MSCLKVNSYFLCLFSQTQKEMFVIVIEEQNISNKYMYMHACANIQIHFNLL